MDLTSVQFTQLQEYIRRYQHVDNLEELFQVIDWRHLHRLLNVNDDSLLRDKVEEVYQDAKEEIYTSPIFLDEELNNIDSLAFIDDNPYHGEVSAMFGALGLKEVNQELNQPEQPENNHHIEQHSSQPRKYGSALSEADGSKHMRGLPVNSAPLNPFVLGAATLSKPASTEMTNLNVLSKASLTASSLQPETKRRRRSLSSLHYPHPR